jgi:hypothetical protein
LEALNNPTKQIKIEQLQNYGYDNYFVQVKYHDTSYNPAEQKQKIKKPLVQLFDQFLSDKTKKYILYIYLKGITPQIISLTTATLDSFLGRTNRFSAVDKADFVTKFTLIYAVDFEKQYALVLQKICVLYSKSIEEAEFYYAVISSYLLEIITNNPPSRSSQRVTSKNEIV